MDKESFDEARAKGDWKTMLSMLGAGFDPTIGDPTPKSYWKYAKELFYTKNLDSFRRHLLRPAIRDRFLEFSDQFMAAYVAKVYLANINKAALADIIERGEKSNPCRHHRAGGEKQLYQVV